MVQLDRANSIISVKKFGKPAIKFPDTFHGQEGADIMAFPFFEAAERFACRVDQNREDFGIIGDDNAYIRNLRNDVPENLGSYQWNSSAVPVFCATRCHARTIG